MGVEQMNEWTLYVLNLHKMKTENEKEKVCWVKSAKKLKWI